MNSDDSIERLTAEAEAEVGYDPTADLSFDPAGEEIEAGPAAGGVPVDCASGVSSPGVVKAFGRIEPIVCRLLGPHWALDPAERVTLAEAFCDAYPRLSLAGHEKLLFWLLLAAAVLPRMPATVGYVLVKTKLSAGTEGGAGVDDQLAAE